MDFPLDDRLRQMVTLDEAGQIRPIGPDDLMEISERWVISSATPEDVARQLWVSRRLFVHCVLVWEFNTVAVAWALAAVESALRWALSASDRQSFASLIEKGRVYGLYGDSVAEKLHDGRKLRNTFSHPRMQTVFSLGMSRPCLETSHQLVQVISDAAVLHNPALVGRD